MSHLVKLLLPDICGPQHLFGGKGPSHLTPFPVLLPSCSLLLCLTPNGQTWVVVSYTIFRGPPTSVRASSKRGVRGSKGSKREQGEQEIDILHDLLAAQGHCQRIMVSRSRSFFVLLQIHCVNIFLYNKTGRVMQLKYVNNQPGEMFTT